MGVGCSLQRGTTTTQSSGLERFGDQHDGRQPRANYFVYRIRASATGFLCITDEESVSQISQASPCHSLLDARDETGESDMSLSPTSKEVRTAHHDRIPSLWETVSADQRADRSRVVESQAGQLLPKVAIHNGGLRGRNTTAGRLGAFISTCQRRDRSFTSASCQCQCHVARVSEVA